MTMQRATPPDGRIETERLVLRPLRLTDAAAITEGLSDFEVSRWLARVPFPYRRVDAERFLVWAAGSQARREERLYAIDTGNGLVGLVSLIALGAAPVLGYWLSRAAWGGGLMPEAAAALVAEAFRDPVVREIRSGVFEGNHRSMRVQEKLGFVVTGRSIQHNLALSADLPHIDTVLTRARHEEFTT
ncbi:GNAT family N-acetyltransferase [Prosthecomicrobium pneumaticum]|uniref:RimJ/RimL family protein N-acetyltransferase n=1 Tax=Prosthecomicrobium pneumaticum TaxID=81895 RepID=A0A7W9L2G1_9HYPH|nr:GNAT family N-acetyltransferase [Prosthecomicrobium pneumaticum]MBB5753487.1 RimJ/RimL family protein N-acetyltransferase [Prosthecomicrobium pneumaticum]